MKTIAALIFSISLLASAAQTPSGLAWNFRPDPADMGGISTNDYTTNFVFVAYQSLTVNTPITNWPAISVSPMSLYANNIIAGVDCTNLLTLTASTAFYVMQVSNIYTGVVSPFSGVAVWFKAPPAGTKFRVLK